MTASSPCRSANSKRNLFIAFTIYFMQLNISYQLKDRIFLTHFKTYQLHVLVITIGFDIYFSETILPSLPLAKKFFLNQAKKIRNLLDFF